jgi:hypothetical protein
VCRWFYAIRFSTAAWRSVGKKAYHTARTTLRYYVGVNAQETAQRIWAAFERHTPAGAEEAIAVPKGNKRGNNCLSDHQKNN